jgi:hypothetical protein
MDPQERIDISNQYPDIVTWLEVKLQLYKYVNNLLYGPTEEDFYITNQYPDIVTSLEVEL